MPSTVRKQTLKQQIKTEIEYFRGFGGFPQTEREMAALVEAFSDASSSVEHLATICKRLRQMLRFCPKPADVYEAAKTIAEGSHVQDWPGPNAPRCADCGGTGWVVRCEEGVNSARYCRCHPAYRYPKEDGPRESKDESTRERRP